VSLVVAAQGIAGHRPIVPSQVMGESEGNILHVRCETVGAA
jgi:hypothetical protein